MWIYGHKHILRIDRDKSLIMHRIHISVKKTIANLDIFLQKPGL